MNKLSLVGLLFVFLCAITACKKNDVSSVNDSFSAVVDGFQWVSSRSYITLSKGPAVHLTIGADSANTHLKLDIGNYTGVGTYTFSDSANTGSYINYYPGSGNIIHKATSGEIIITENSSVNNSPASISGTFRFLADTISVQSGTFSVKLNLN